MNSGRWVIVTILAVACGATAFAWWFRSQQGQQTLAFWGSQAAYSIRFAPEVTAWRLRAEAVETQNGWEKFPIDGQDWYAQSCSISQAKGLVHARQALIEDASYLWESAPTAVADWDFVVRFAGPKNSTAAADPTAHAATEHSAMAHSASVGKLFQEVVMLLDTRQQIVRPFDGDRSVSLTIGEGLRTFLGEQFAGEPSAIKKSSAAVSE